MKKFRLVSSIIALIFVLAIVGFGIYVALMPWTGIHNNVTFIPYEKPSFEIECSADYADGEGSSTTITSAMGEPGSHEWAAPDINFNRTNSATLRFVFKNQNETGETISVTISGIVTDYKNVEWASNPRFTAQVSVGDSKTVVVGRDVDPEAGEGNDVGFTVAPQTEVTILITYTLERTEDPIDVRQELVFNITSIRPNA